MTIKALWTIRTDEKSVYEVGSLVKGLSAEEEERLIFLGAAEMVLTEKVEAKTEEEDLKTETKPKKERG